MMAGMTRPPLPVVPARVRVTLADGTEHWLADPPERLHGEAAGPSTRWRLVPIGEPEHAGVWPWWRAVELEREVRQAWRRQLASAEEVEGQASNS